MLYDKPCNTDELQATKKAAMATGAEGERVLRDLAETSHT